LLCRWQYPWLILLLEFRTQEETGHVGLHGEGRAVEGQCETAVSEDILCAWG
jgi:hypothetical protein